MQGEKDRLVFRFYLLTFLFFISFICFNSNGEKGCLS
jgi:hypothetical protein